MMAGFIGMTLRLIRVSATRGRIIAMAAVGLLGVGVGVIIDRSDPGSDFEPAEFLSGFGLTIYVPLVALVIASATLGVLREERTLVYFWLRPIGRWQITAAAFIAGLVVLVPLVLIPLLLLGSVIGDGADIAGVAVASLVGIVGYASLFTLMGLLTTRALYWGLAYILLWEGFIAGLSRGAGSLALSTYTRSTLSRIADVPDLINDPAPSTTIVIVMIGVVLVGFALTTYRLQTIDVD